MRARADFAVPADLLARNAGIQLPLASSVGAAVFLAALKVVAASSLIDTNAALTKLSATAIAVKAAAKSGCAPAVGAELAGKT